MYCRLLLLLLLSGCTTNHPLAPTDIVLRQRADARIALGIGYLKQNDYRKARENFTTAIEYQPDYYRAQLAMAHYLVTVQQTQAAQALFQQALHDHPHNGQVLNNFGTFLCQQREFEQAQQLFLRAVNQPGYHRIADSYENAALCAAKSGQTQQARGYFENALAHQPDRTRSMFNLAQLDIASGNYIQAQQRLAQFERQYGFDSDGLALNKKLQQNIERARTKPIDAIDAK